MAERIHILSPTDVKPGSVGPGGAIVKHATMFTNVEAGMVMVAVEYVGERPSRGSLVSQGDMVKHNVDEVFTWPLANGWTVDQRTAE